MPKTEGHRPGGRNKQFFTGLSGLASGLNAVIDKNRAPEESFESQAAAQRAKIDAAEAKRAKRAARNQ